MNDAIALTFFVYFFINIFVMFIFYAHNQMFSIEHRLTSKRIFDILMVLLFGTIILAYQGARQWLKIKVSKSY